MHASTSTPTSFAVTPPTAHVWWIMGLLLLLPAIAVVALLLFPSETTGQQSTSGTAIALVTIGIAAIACAIGLKRRVVRIDGRTLRVVAGLFRHSVLIDQLDVSRARVVDLDEHTELRPSIKTMGMSVPGYQAGRFRMREKLGKVFCLLTDRRRVLWLPHLDGKDQLLLSLEHPQALLDALKIARG